MSHNKRNVAAWLLVAGFFAAGYSFTHQADEMDETRAKDVNTFTSQILKNAGDGHEMDLSQKRAFLAYFGYPDTVRDDKQIITLKPVHPRGKDFDMKILVDGKVVCQADRESLESYYVGRERQNYNAK